MSLESKKTTADSKLVEEHLVVTCGGLIHNQQLTHPTLVTMVGHGIIVFKDVIALTVSKVRFGRCEPNLTKLGILTNLTMAIIMALSVFPEIAWFNS